MLKYSVAFFSLILFSSLAIAADPSATFVGKYKCEGHDPYLDKDYTGTIEIIDNSPVYHLKMKYSTGEDMEGTGGQYNNQLLFVVFQDKKNLKRVGLEQYEWKDNKLAGYWVYLNENKLGREICEKQIVTSFSNH